MNDHVHVLVEPLAGHELSAITHSWKSFTAHELQRNFKRKGEIWQDESFDRIIRDEVELSEKAQYIQNNPFKRWPDLSEYDWVGFPQWEPESKGLENGAEIRPESGPGSGPGVPAWQSSAWQSLASQETGTEACPTEPRVIFGIEQDVPVRGGNTAQKREHDKRLGAGTMSRSGAKCPCCSAIMTMEDIRVEGQAGRLGAINTAVVVDGQNGKEFRLPTALEIQMPQDAEKAVPDLFAQIPFGLPTEPLPRKEAWGFRVPLYGFDQWGKLFTPRQLLSLGTFVKWTREAAEELTKRGNTVDWVEAIVAYLGCTSDFVLNRNSLLCTWTLSRETTRSTFARFALPITWDFAEASVLEEGSGSYWGAVDWIARYVEHALLLAEYSPAPTIELCSATVPLNEAFDYVVTDPPYYDAIPYSDLMDYFYVWVRRTQFGLGTDLAHSFKEPLAPKWNHGVNDGELIDDASRHGGDRVKSKTVYEEGMARAFQACHTVLKPEGKLVVVFANKQPDAWETLVSALIRAGFVVDGSWPIQTEMGNRTRALTGAALASSVWLVCKKREALVGQEVGQVVGQASLPAKSQAQRPGLLRPGWDNQVLEEMRRNIREQLREFWDAGIRGPDFVWAATGPALEAYSKHPVVKKANEPGPMTVSEFLTHVRRMVVDFVVGRVLSGESGAGVPTCQEPGTEAWPTESLDAPTAYYLLHRHDFGLDDAPAGACILYAISCGLSDKELADTWNLIAFTKGSGTGVPAGQEQEEENWEEEPGAETWPTEEEGSGSKVKLKSWAQRARHRGLDHQASGGSAVPLIDRVHCLMHLWKGGDLLKVDEYLDANGLRRQELFKRLLRSLVELSPRGSEERSLLESLSNHVGVRSAMPEVRQGVFSFREEE
jgi:hypothetical protein